MNVNKNISWINFDYMNTAYDKELDKKYYDNIDKIITVLEYGRKSILDVNRDYGR